MDPWSLFYPHLGFISSHLITLTYFPAFSWMFPQLSFSLKFFHFLLCPALRLHTSILRYIKRVFFCLDPSVKSPGFYTEQYVQHHQQHQMIAATSLSHPHYSMGPVEPITVMPMGNHDYSTALSALYEHSANFPMKSEPRQHMPPTPPGEWNCCVHMTAWFEYLLCVEDLLFGEAEMVSFWKYFLMEIKCSAMLKYWIINKYLQI